MVLSVSGYSRPSLSEVHCLLAPREGHLANQRLNPHGEHTAGHPPPPRQRRTDSPGSEEAMVGAGGKWEGAYGGHQSTKGSREGLVLVLVIVG